MVGPLAPCQRDNCPVALLDALAQTSASVASTPGRLAKVQLLADCLAGLAAEEIPVAVSYVAGELPQGPIGVGWAALRDLPAPAPAATLGLLEVDTALRRIGALSGAGSQAARRRELVELFARAT